MWVSSGPSNIPDGAVIAGNTAQGRPLYLANVFRDSDWSVGIYDPLKDCAEYGWAKQAFCRKTWQLAVLLRREFLITIPYPITP